MGLCQQYAALWPADQQAVAAAVCMGESSGNPSAENYNPPVEDSVGLFQINLLAHGDISRAQALDPAFNAHYALGLWQQQGWSPWGAYTSGTYKRFLAGGPVSLSPAGAQAVASAATPPNTSQYVAIGALAFAAIIGIGILESV